VLLPLRPDTDTLITEILQRLLRSQYRRKPVKWLDTAPPEAANKRSLMVIDRGDEVTQPKQAFVELQGGCSEGALILLAPSRRALFSSLFYNQQ
jgi:hypothetical protein